MGTDTGHGRSSFVEYTDTFYLPSVTAFGKILAITHELLVQPPSDLGETYNDIIQHAVSIDGRTLPMPTPPSQATP